MIPANIPHNENQRLQALRNLQIMDTPYEDRFTDVVELASRICETPISLITLVDSDRQWFKARKGLEVTQTSRSASFCAHAILQNEVFIVNDAEKDARFFDNELVTGAPNIRFYAGAQITSPQGHKLGTLCVIDSQPKDLSWQQVSTLRILSQQVSSLIELRHLQGLQQRHQKTVSEKEIAVEKMQEEQRRLNQLVQQQNADFALRLQNTLAPLKTGVFTKKSLSAITAKITEQFAQSALFADAVSLLSAQENAKPAEQFFVSECTSAVLAELEPFLQAKRCKINCRIPQQLCFLERQTTVHFLLKFFLYRLLCAAEKTEINVLILKKQSGLEIRMGSASMGIDKTLSEFSVATKNESSEGNQPKIYETAILHEVLKKTQADCEILQLGENGTEILLTMPEMQAMASVTEENQTV